MALIFEWDANKAAANVRKHGVTFAEASSVFADPHGRVVNDPRHSLGEVRLALLGYSRQGRLLAVMFTEREAERIRLISARKATRTERDLYEKAF